MSGAWLEVAQGGTRRRLELAPGLTRLGGSDCEVAIDGAGEDQLHVWSDPPKVIFVGQGTPPLLDGRAFEEAGLTDGASLQWAGAIVVYREPRRAPVIEELPGDERGSVAAAARPGRAQPEVPAPAGARSTPGERLVLAGLLADLGLADRKVVKRWQDAILRGEFDPQACARELLAAATCAPDEPRLVERASRLQRDLLMMPFQRGLRGAGRRARAATRTGMAYLVANLIAISVYTLVLVAIMLLLRVQYGTSFDGAIDRFLKLITPSGGAAGS